MLESSSTIISRVVGLAWDVGFLSQPSSREDLPKLFGNSAGLHGFWMKNCWKLRAPLEEILKADYTSFAQDFYSRAVWSSTSFKEAHALS